MPAQLDASALAAFIQVTQTGSFSEAAVELHITQSAISKRIAQLEDVLGQALFNRLGRQLSLTQAGQLLYERAASILAQMEDTQRAIANLSGEVSGQLDLATSHHIGLHRLPPVLRLFASRFAQVRLNLQFFSSEEICAQVEHGRIELGVVTLPSPPPPQLQMEKIWTDNLVFVAAPEFLHEHNINAKKLAGLPAILPAQGTFTRDLLDNAFKCKGLSVTPTLSTNYLETIKMLVTVGLGWSLLPENMIGKELRCLDVDNIQLQRDLGLIYHRRRTLSNAARAMRELLHAQAV